MNHFSATNKIEQHKQFLEFINAHSITKNNSGYKHNKGDKEIPINVQKGYKPGEKQLDIVRKVLTEDFLVNDDTSGGTEQRYPAIALGEEGNFVVVWEDRRGGNWDIYFQRYDVNGIAQGVNTKANYNDGGDVDQGYPSVAMDTAGNFIIAWTDYRDSDLGIYFQRYNYQGMPLGINTKADDGTGSPYLLHSSVAIGESGDFIIAWDDFRSGDFDIYFQKFNVHGISVGTNTKVNDDSGTSDQRYPSLVIDESGGFLITWEDKRSGNSDIYFQMFGSNGVPLGLNTKVNDDAGTANQKYPSVVTDVNSNFIIAWEDTRNGNYDIYYQKYKSNRTPDSVNIKVNSDAGTADQNSPTITLDGSGNFIITWEDRRNGNYDIYCQKYNSNGSPDSINIKINDDVGSVLQSSPSAGMNSNGKLVVVWCSGRNGIPDIYYQVYSEVFMPLGVNTKANDDMGSADQYFSSIAMDGEGNFIVVWMDERNGKVDVYFQRYTNLGTAIGINTKVNEDSGFPAQWYPSIAMDRSGNFIIVWGDSRNLWPDIYFQRYNSSGLPVGINTKVNDDSGLNLQLSPRVAMDGMGNFVIVWRDRRSGNFDVYSQRYNNDGIRVGSNSKVNDDAGSADQHFPSIAMNGEGKFVIVWGDSRNVSVDIYFQRYSAEGISIGSNTKVNDALGYPGYPSVAMDGTGKFVIAWEDFRNSNWDVYCQRYDSEGVPADANKKVNDDEGSAYQYSAWIAMDDTGKFVIVWEDHRFGLSNADVIAQRFFSNGAINGSNYKIVRDGTNYGQEWPAVAANNSTIIFSWDDNRRLKGYDVYAKRVGWDWSGVVSVPEGEELISSFQLLQNYPNPFNPNTRIRWSVPNACYQTLRVYDVLGREIATLVDEYRNAGSYDTEFDAGKLSSGIYLYKLQAGNLIQTKKMVVSK